MDAIDMKKFRCELKNALKSYSGMTKTLRRKLSSLGFTITDGGKHYKLYFREDKHHSYTLSKTPSDSRSGLNFATDVLRMIAI